MSFTQDKAYSLVQQANEVGRLAHAYLITGPRGSGKRQLAKQMIEMVDTRGGGGAAELSDLRGEFTYLVEPESKSRKISVAAMRGAEHMLHNRCPSGVTKHAVICDADCMGVEAENAFLKTLEEPPDNSRLLLITSRPELLLDTILSRCIQLDLMGPSGPVPVPENVLPFLQALSSHALQEVRGVSGALGLMSKFSSLLKSEKEDSSKDSETAYKQESEKYKNTTDGLYVKGREDFYKAQAEAQYLDRRNQLVEFLVLWFGDALRIKSGNQNLDLPEFSDATGQIAKNLTEHDLFKRIAAVEKLQQT
ncbi:MAG: hypothetical protein AAF226_11485, partial [Verrucomicrobiota bacterium]